MTQLLPISCLSSVLSNPLVWVLSSRLNSWRFLFPCFCWLCVGLIWCTLYPTFLCFVLGVSGVESFRDPAQSAILTGHQLLWTHFIILWEPPKSPRRCNRYKSVSELAKTATNGRYGGSVSIPKEVWEKKKHLGVCLCNLYGDMIAAFAT